jgi:DNA-binding response OmpR family regulator
LTAEAGGHVATLSTREFSLLATFLDHAGSTLSREELLAEVWDLDFDPGTNIVNVYVGYLRKKLPSLRIETVRGVGYRLAR